MTVSDLIEKLLQMPQEADVHLDTWDLYIAGSVEMDQNGIVRIGIEE